jgi:hypothetical protein
VDPERRFNYLRFGIVLKFHFPYRRVATEARSTLASPPGFFLRLVHVLTGRGFTSPIPKATEIVPRPFVSVRIRGPVGSRRLRSALLDTGSQDTLFPLELAAPLGIVLGGERQTIKWRGQRYWVEYQIAELELAQTGVAWRWRYRVGFTRAPLTYALLGQRGCLDFLDAKLCGADQTVELETNRAFPRQ